MPAPVQIMQRTGAGFFADRNRATEAQRTTVFQGDLRNDTVGLDVLQLTQERKEQRVDPFAE